MNVGVDDGIYKSRHHHEIHELLNEMHALVNIIQLDIMITFRDSKEAKEHNTIAMCSSDIIVYVSNREINWPVLIVSCSYRYGGFITVKNDGAKDGTIGFRILRNYVLNTMSVSIKSNG